MGSLPPFSSTEPCQDEEPVICCEAMTVDCLACKAGVDPETYCSLPAFSRTEVCQDEEPEEEMGCCYDVGRGSMMRDCCHELHGVHQGDVNSMVGESECPIGERRGGETRFSPGSCLEIDAFTDTSGLTDDEEEESDPCVDLSCGDSCTRPCPEGM